MICQVSVILTVRNVEQYIKKCLESIINQSVQDIEIIVVDDNSDDRTQEVIAGLHDKRLRYFRNRERLGLTRNRNKGLKYAVGEYLFFTDGDCIVPENWVQEGLEYFKKFDCLGVEGKVYYISENYKPSFSDHICTNLEGGLFMTGNVAYTRKIIQKVGGFDERYSYHEDRDIALRIKKFGKICFNPRMITFVQKETLTPKTLIGRAGVIKNRVYLFKRFGDKALITWRIVDLKNLIKILFPPLLFASLLSNSFRDACDYRLLPFVYIRIILERVLLWRTCAKEKVFLI